MSSGFLGFIERITDLNMRKKGKVQRPKASKFYPERWELELEELTRFFLFGVVGKIKNASLKDIRKRIVKDESEEYISNSIYRKLEEIASHVVEYNTVAFANFSEAAVGERYIPDTPGKEQLISTWRDTMVNSMQTASTEAKQKASKIVEQGFVNGYGRRQIEKQLEELLANFPKAKASLIARTEMGHLNSAVAKAQSESAGVDCYEWSCAMDGRTRESHGLLDGKICRWDNPNVYSDNKGKTWKQRDSRMYIGHPGTDFNCRCTALPWLAELEDDFEDARPKGNVEGVIQNFEKEDNYKNNNIDVLGYYDLKKYKMPDKYRDFLSKEKSRAVEEAVNNEYGFNVHDEESILDSIENTNPKRNKYRKEWHLNCAYCVNTYLARKRGFEVKAKPYIEEEFEIRRVPNEKERGFLTALDDAVFETKDKNLSQEEYYKFVKQKVKKSGEGSVFFISGAYEIPHVMIVENIKGKVMFIDPQTAEASEKCDMYIYEYDGIARVDNCKFNKKLKLYAKNKF